MSGPAQESESEVAQSCPTLCDPKDCSPPCSSIHGIFQARVLEWGAISFSTNCPPNAVGSIDSAPRRVTKVCILRVKLASDTQRPHKYPDMTAFRGGLTCLCVAL